MAAVETPDPARVRFRLKAAVARLPDVLLERDRRGVDRARRSTSRRWGDEGLRTKAPVGAGPYRFVSFTPGVELVLEAVDQYWRATPRVKRLVFRSIPDPSTRFAALKRGEIDITVLG